MLEAGTPVVVPEFDGPARECDLVFATPPAQDVVALDDDAPAQSSGLTHTHAGWKVFEVAVRERRACLAQECDDGGRPPPGLGVKGLQILRVEGIEWTAGKAGEVEGQIGLAERP